jgi:hypothetical protein
MLSSANSVVIPSAVDTMAPFLGAHAVNQSVSAW